MMVDNSVTESLFGKGQIKNDSFKVLYHQAQPLKKQEKSPEYIPDTDSYEVFIGNIPLTAKRQAFKKFLQQYGNVTSVRFRSLPLSQDETFQKLYPHKVAAKLFNNSSKSHDVFDKSRTSKNCYAKFETEESALDCVAKLNGFYYQNSHHLRVNMVNNDSKKQSAKPNKTGSISQKFDRKRSIFIGNLPVHKCEDEDLWELFQKKLGLDVESVRVVRCKDAITGTGCGFILFKDQNSVNLALHHDQKKKINGRVIRIKKCFKKPKVKSNNKTGTKIIRNKKRFNK